MWTRNRRVYMQRTRPSIDRKGLSPLEVLMTKSLVSTLALTALVAGSLIAVNVAAAAPSAPQTSPAHHANAPPPHTPAAHTTPPSPAATRPTTPTDPQTGAATST